METISVGTVVALLLVGFGSGVGLAIVAVLVTST